MPIQLLKHQLYQMYVSFFSLYDHYCIMAHITLKLISSTDLLILSLHTLTFAKKFKLLWRCWAEEKKKKLQALGIDGLPQHYKAFWGVFERPFQGSTGK